MNNNTLEIGRSYSLKYKAPWTDYELKDVTVVAITTEKQSSQYGVDSIYSEFFSRFGIGLANYVEMINASSDLYVCQSIDTREPLKLGDSLLLLPKIIIDFGNSEELLKCDKIMVKVNGLLFYSPLVYNRGEFLKELLTSIKNSLKNTKEYGDTPINIQYETIDIVKGTTEYKKYIELKDYTYNLEKVANEQHRAQHNIDLRAMINKSIELDSMKADYTQKIVDLEESIRLYTNAKSNYESMSNIVNTNATVLFSGLENSTIEVDSVEYYSRKNAIMGAVTL